VAVADEVSDRADFASYTLIFDAVCKSVQLNDMIGLVAKFFPSAKTGCRLKGFLFGARNDHASIFLPTYDERDVLFALGTTSAFEGLDGESLDCEREARSYALRRRTAQFR